MAESYLSGICELFFRLELGTTAVCWLLIPIIALICTTGKTLAAMLANSAVRPRTAKNSLSCYKTTMHGNDMAHGKDATKHTATSEAR
jgi:hypothetical protein